MILHTSLQTVVFEYFKIDYAVGRRRLTNAVEVSLTVAPLTGDVLARKATVVVNDGEVVDVNAVEGFYTLRQDALRAMFVTDGNHGVGSELAERRPVTATERKVFEVKHTLCGL